MFYDSLNKDEDDEKLLGLICSENTCNIEEFLDVAKFWGIRFYPLNFFDLLNEDPSQNYI